MKAHKVYLLVFSLVIPFFALSQVGIGTITPNAQLEIKSTNQSTPTNTDGIIIPKIDEFPNVNPTASQDGMMVYVTGNGSETKGFYYWNHSGTDWITIVGSQDTVTKINELSDGKSDNDGTHDGSSIYLGIDAGLNDDATNNNNIGIGKQTLRENVNGTANTAVGINALLLNVNGNYNTAIGSNALFRNVSGTSNIGIGLNTMYYNQGDANTAIGRRALFVNSTGNSNVALGYQSAQQVIGDNNVFIGRGASGVATTHNKSGSIFIGFEAGFNELASNRLYIENSNSGAPLIYGEFDNDVLRVNGTLQVGNPSGTGYVFPTNRGTSDQVLKTNASGNVSWVNVTSFGSEKIDDLTDGKTNTVSNSIYLGVNAGTVTTDANIGNVSIGQNTLSSLTTGGYNIAIGDLALEDITNGASNVALGNYALTNKTSGSNNVALGSHTQFWNTTGIENSSIGLRSLYGNSGNYNTAVGAHAGHSSSGNSNIFIGYSSGYNESGNNKLYIENSNANANNALVYGEFDTNLFRINGSFQVSNPVGTGTNHFEVRDTGSSFFGGATYWKQNNTTGTTVASLFNIGDDGAFTVNNGGNAQHFIYGAGTTAFNLLQLDSDFQISGDNNANLLYVDASTDRIGIGTSIPNTKLQIIGGSDASLANGSGYVVLGNISGANIVIDENEIIARNNGVNGTLYLNQTGGDVWAGGALVHSSDGRLKRNIEDLGYGLKEVLQLQPKQYFWKNRENQKHESLGLIAQDVQNVINNIVHESDDENKTLSVNYTELIPVLINAIKEQNKQIEALKEDISLLKEQSKKNNFK